MDYFRFTYTIFHSFSLSKDSNKSFLIQRLAKTAEEFGEGKK